jgi:hypothetical protein
MVRKSLTAALVLGLALVPAATAGNGKGGGSLARGYTPEQAEALASAPGHSLGVSVTPVSKQDALAAMTQAGAETTLAPGYATPQQAVAAASGCASYVSGWGWGTWPYDQQVYDHTYYCAVTGDHITSVSTTVTTGATLCGTASTSHFWYSGGVGYSWVTVQAQATFSCPTAIPYLSLHPTDWLRTAYNDWGNAAQVAHS